MQCIPHGECTHMHTPHVPIHRHQELLQRMMRPIREVAIRADVMLPGDVGVGAELATAQRLLGALDDTPSATQGTEPQGKGGIRIVLSTCCS